MKLFYTLAGIILFSTASLSQTSVTITADRDNTIFSESSNSNGAGANFFSGANQGTNRRRGLLHFNVSGIPADATISTATLNLNVVQLASAATGQPLRAHKLNASWGEGSSAGSGSGAAATTNDATWTNRFTGTSSPWATPGGVFVPTPSGSVTVASAGAVSITGAAITSDVQSWINNGAGNFGWIILGNEALPQSAMSVASKDNGTVSLRPTITITYTTLPVTLKSFSARVQKQDVLLEWLTATEINNQYFGIEHSTNGTTFTEVSRVAGAGNSVLPKQYAYTHINVAGGKHFYRLAQHDANGHIQYSGVVVAGIAGKKILLQIAPNPVADKINIQATELLTGRQYRVTSAAGQIVLSGTVSGQSIAVANIAAGTYQLTIDAPAGETITAAFIKR